jgi:hypothetical protein
VARLQRVDYADNDQGSNRSTQHNNPREIRKTSRKRRRPIHGGESFYIYTFLGIHYCTSHTNENNLFIKIGGPTTSLSRAKLADRRWPRRDHERTSHLDWGRTCNSGQLATHPPAQSLCISTIPAPRGIAVVGRQAIIDPTTITRIFHIPVMLWMFGHTYSSTGAEIEGLFYLQSSTTSESYRTRGQGSCAGEFFLFGSFYYCSVWVLGNCTSFHDRYPIVHVSLSLTGYYT